MEEHCAVVGSELKCPMVRNVQGFEGHLLRGVAGHETIIDVVMIIDAAAAHLQDTETSPSLYSSTSESVN